jgi:hypothetical protein
MLCDESSVEVSEDMYNENVKCKYFTKYFANMKSSATFI